MTRIRSIVLIAFLTLTVTAAAAEGPDLGHRMSELMSDYHEKDLFNGTALVVSDGEVVLRGGYGLADEEWKIPNTPDTKFRLGSITKQFTSMLVMQQVADGRLRLDQTLSELLPWYRQDTGSLVTLEQLLNHTSGIPSYTSDPDFFPLHSRDPLPVRQLVETYCSGDLEFEPGTQWRYNNSGYVILGAVLEEATGRPYDALLQERILRPLGMDDTGYDHTAEIVPRRARGYQSAPGGLRNAPYLDMSLPHAAGALYSTVDDLAIWDRALYGTELLPADLKAVMLTPGLEDYAFGWRVATQPVGPDDSPRTVVTHGGGINGFGTVIVRIPEDRNLVVLLDNHGGRNLDSVRTGLIDLLYGREPAPPAVPVSRMMLDEIASNGVDAALTRYRELIETDASGWKVDEAELNLVGYALLAQGDPDGAVTVFEVNVEAYPESFNVYDSLAEALAAAGETEEAIRNYARSLELNPGNTNAIRMLQRLAGVDPD
jgi:CubicO group peptidase (beta-lactamase class C family)